MVVKDVYSKEEGDVYEPAPYRNPVRLDKKRGAFDIEV